MAARKNRRGNPDGPPSRGRRGHSSIAAQPGFKEWLEGKLLENPDITYDALVELMKGTGFWASRSSIARFGVKFERACAELELLILQAKVMAREDPEETLALEQATSRMAMSRLFQHLRDGTQVDELEAATYKSIAQLQSSSASRERAVTLANGKTRAAIQLFIRMFTEHFKNDKLTLKKVLALAERTLGKEVVQ